MSFEQISDLSTISYTTDPYGYVRHITRAVQVGSVAIGAENSIRVQATITADLLDTRATVAQIKELIGLSCEIIRLNVLSIEMAQSLGNIRAEMQAQNIVVPLVACLPFETALVFEAARWVDCLSLTLPLNKNTIQLETQLNVLIPMFQKDKPSLEIVLGPLVPENMLELVNAALNFTDLIRPHQFHNLIFSVTAPDPITATKAYRFLVACLRQLQWDYPLHLVGTGTTTGEPGYVGAVTALGTLLEDGIGDSLEIPLNGEPQRALNLSWRIVRRYTEIHWSVLEKAGVNVPINSQCDKNIPAVYTDDEMPVVLASHRANHKQAAKDLAHRYAKQSKKVPFYGKPLEEFPFVIADEPDYRNPYLYTRRFSSEVQIGNVKIGGNKLIPIIGKLGERDTSENLVDRYSNLRGLLDKQWINQFWTEEKLNDTLQRRLEVLNSSVSQPDLFILDYIDAGIRTLKTSGLIKQPFIITVQDAEEARAALTYNVDALAICVDSVAQIGIYLSDLEAILKVLELHTIPLLLISTLNAGQSWGSYDYWPQFSEAYQMIKAIELCYKYGLTQLIVSIYTYNTAWNIQNNRLLVALLQERSWTLPIHLIAPDVNSPMLEERLVDAAISLGSLLTDGLADSIQADYVSKDGFDGFNPLTTI